MNQTLQKQLVYVGSHKKHYIERFEDIKKGIYIPFKLEFLIGKDFRHDLSCIPNWQETALSVTRSRRLKIG